MLPSLKVNIIPKSKNKTKTKKQWRQVILAEGGGNLGNKMAQKAHLSIAVTQSQQPGKQSVPQNSCHRARPKSHLCGPAALAWMQATQTAPRKREKEKQLHWKSYHQPLLVLWPMLQFPCRAWIDRAAFWPQVEGLFNALPLHSLLQKSQNTFLTLKPRVCL